MERKRSGAGELLIRKRGWGTRLGGVQRIGPRVKPAKQQLLWGSSAINLKVEGVEQ